MHTEHRLFPRSLILFAVPLIAAVAIACSSGDDDPESTATPGGTTTPVASAPTPSPAAFEAPAEPTATVPLPSVTPIVGAAEPDGERIFEAIDTFSNTIGARVAGTENERIAAGLIADWLDQLGYEVELQEFGIGTQIARSSTLTIEGPDAQNVPTLPFANSGAAIARGRLVDAGRGLPEDFPSDTAGAIALIERDGEVFFNVKVANAIAAGAAGVIIYNNQNGILNGGLEPAVGIPVVGISQTEGQNLVAALEEGPVMVGIEVGALSDLTSYNVIARPPGADCETITGGHYDSVQLGTGASDNASGTATVLEVAAVLAHEGEMGSNCFVLFGAEELGLFGSRHFVSQLSVEEKDRIQAMLNLDMVGVGAEAWWLIGTPELQQRMVAIAGDLGISDAVPSELIRGLSSDHASFIEAGIPALMFHRWEDPLLHTPQDTTERIEPEYLEEAARMTIALLESLGTEG